MRVLLAVVVAALAVAASPAPAAAPAPAAPTLASDRAKVSYGDVVSLTGRVPGVGSGEKLTLRAEVLTPSGAKQVASVAQAQTDAAGEFRFRTAPSAQTTFTATWDAAPGATTTSEPVTVRVAPRLTFGVVSRLGRTATFSIKAVSAVPYAGRIVHLQRRTRADRWVTLKRVVLTSNASGTRTAVRVPKGLSRLRVLMSQSQVGAGYIPGVSRILLVRL